MLDWLYKLFMTIIHNPIGSFLIIGLLVIAIKLIIYSFVMDDSEEGEQTGGYKGNNK